MNLLFTDKNGKDEIVIRLDLIRRSCTDGDGGTLIWIDDKEQGEVAILVAEPSVDVAHTLWAMTNKDDRTTRYRVNDLLIRVGRIVSIIETGLVETGLVE